MALFIYTLLENLMIKIIGNMALASALIVFVMLCLVIWRGLDFRYALMIFAPGLARICQAGWWPKWIEGVLWIIVAGFGLYIIWAYVINRT